MGNQVSCTTVGAPVDGDLHGWWKAYVRAEWRTLRSKQLDEFKGLGRKPLRRGESRQMLLDMENKMTQARAAAGADEDEQHDLAVAIAKLNTSSGILNTEKRAIERMLAQRYEEALTAAAAAERDAGAYLGTLGGGSLVLVQVLAVMQQHGMRTELEKDAAPPAEWRTRIHAARRRAFLVVRAAVRMRREMSRAHHAMPALDWLVPVAAQERLGHLKAAVARHRDLEGYVHDVSLALQQVDAVRAAPVARSTHTPPRTAMSPPRTAASQARAAASPPRTAGAPPRTAPSQRASEPGVPFRGSLTADPPAFGPGSGCVSPGLNSPAASRAVGYRASLNGGSQTPLSPRAASPMHRKSELGATSGNSAGVNRLLQPMPSLSNRASASGLPPGPPPVRISYGGGTPGGCSSPLARPQTSLLAGSSNPGTPSSLSTPGGVWPSMAMILGATNQSQGAASLPGVNRTSVSGRAAAVASASPTTAIVRQTFMHGEGGTPTHGRTSHSGGNSLFDSPTSHTPTGSLLGNSNGANIFNVNLARRMSLVAEGPSPLAMERASTPPLVKAPVSPQAAALPALVVAEPASPTMPAPPSPGPGARPGTPTRLLSAARPGTALLPMTLTPTLAPRLGTANNGGGSARFATSSQAATTPTGAQTLTLDPTGPAGLSTTQMGKVGRSFSRNSSSRNAAAAAATANYLQVSSPHALGHGAAAETCGSPCQTPDAGAIPGTAPIQLIMDGETLDQAFARLQVQLNDARDLLADSVREFQEEVARCNSSWVDLRGFASPKTHDAAAIDDWMDSEKYTIFRADVVRSLKAGGVAFQFMITSDDSVRNPKSGNVYDVWSSDPWDMAADLAPQKVGGADVARMIGLPVGVRALQQLVNAVEDAAGPSAVDALPVVITISEQQQNSLMADILQHGIYRRLRSNLYILVQPNQPTLKWSFEANGFVEDKAQPTYLPGGGYAMLMMGWPGYALHFNENGEIERLQGTLAEELCRKDVEWMVSRNGNDMTLCSGDGALDMRHLAHMAYLYSQPECRYSMALQASVTYTKGQELVDQYGSIVLSRKPKTSSMVAGKLDASVRLDRYRGGTVAQLPVVELSACEMNSAHMQEQLAEMQRARLYNTAVGIGRYIFRMQALATVVTGPVSVRPKLFPAVAVESSARPLQGADKETGGSSGSSTSALVPAGATLASSDGCLLHVKLLMTDLSAHHAFKVVALRAVQQPAPMRGLQDVDDLVRLVRAQDEELGNAPARLAARIPSFKRSHRPGQNILVFVQDNGVSVTATNVAIGLVRRERGDTLHLVTVVPTEAQQREGHELMARLLKQFKSHLDVATHVLVQEGRGLLECIADTVEQHSCGLLVVGSSTITRMGGSGMPGTPLNGMPSTPMMRGSTPGTPSLGAGRPSLAQQQAAMLAGGAGAGAGGPGAAMLGMLADAQGAELLLSSVALSMLRTFGLPTIIVTSNTKAYLKRHGPSSTDATRNASGSMDNVRLNAMAVVERHSRPMMHHLLHVLMEPALRQDQLALVQALPPGVRNVEDLNVVQALALRMTMTSMEVIASRNEFRSVQKTHAGGDWDKALCTAAREGGAQLLCVQLPPGMTRMLPTQLLHLIRGAPCPVLVYPEKVDIPGMSVAGLSAD